MVRNSICGWMLKVCVCVCVCARARVCVRVCDELGKWCDGECVLGWWWCSGDEVVLSGDDRM